MIERPVIVIGSKRTQQALEQQSYKAALNIFKEEKSALARNFSPQAVLTRINRARLGDAALISRLQTEVGQYYDTEEVLPQKAADLVVVGYTSPGLKKDSSTVKAAKERVLEYAKDHPQQDTENDRKQVALQTLAIKAQIEEDTTLPQRDAVVATGFVRSAILHEVSKLLDTSNPRTPQEVEQSVEKILKSIKPESKLGKFIQQHKFTSGDLATNIAEIAEGFRNNGLTQTELSEVPIVLGDVVTDPTIYLSTEKKPQTMTGRWLAENARTIIGVGGLAVGVTASVLFGISAAPVVAMVGGAAIVLAGGARLHKVITRSQQERKEVTIAQANGEKVASQKEVIAQAKSSAKKLREEVGIKAHKTRNDRLLYVSSYLTPLLARFGENVRKGAIVDAQTKYGERKPYNELSIELKDSLEEITRGNSNYLPFLKLAVEAVQRDNGVGRFGRDNGIDKANPLVDYGEQFIETRLQVLSQAASVISMIKEKAGDSFSTLLSQAQKEVDLQLKKEVRGANRDILGRRSLQSLRNLILVSGALGLLERFGFQFATDALGHGMTSAVQHAGENITVDMQQRLHIAGQAGDSILEKLHDQHNTPYITIDIEHPKVVDGVTLLPFTSQGDPNTYYIEVPKGLSAKVDSSGDLILTNADGVTATLKDPILFSDGNPFTGSSEPTLAYVLQEPGVNGQGELISLPSLVIKPELKNVFVLPDIDIILPDRNNTLTYSQATAMLLSYVPKALVSLVAIGTTGGGLYAWIRHKRRRPHH